MPSRLLLQHSSRALAKSRSIASPPPIRSISRTSPTMVNVSDLSISEGHSPETVAEGATQLIDQGKWTLCNEGQGLEREFKFKTFKTTWEFMNTVAEECKKTRHHPEWSNVYNSTKIRWTTHNPEGLSEKDTTMASFCDEAAKSLGEIEPSEGKNCCGKV